MNALWHHWGSAYVITHPEPGVWLAERRDNHETLSASDPAGLYDLITADYAARKVSRQAAP